jgi:hypothetical protein
MNFEVPEGTTVQIFIGAAPLAPIQNVLGMDPPPGHPLEARRRRPLLKGVAVAGLAFVAFAVGQKTAPHRDVLMMASNASVPPAGAAPTPAVPRYEQAFPLRTPDPASSQPSPPAGPVADQVPQAFAQQLQQRPTITPSPGSPPPPAASSGAKPFGLED